MEESKLIQILTMVEQVYCNRWNTVCKIVDIISDVEVVEKSWNKEYKNNSPEWYPLDLSKISTWSTYDRSCIDLKFSMEDVKLICDVKIWDGSTFDGTLYKESRFNAKLILPINFVSELSDEIERRFDSRAEYAYEEYLEQQKLMWIENYKKDILKH